MFPVTITLSNHAELEAALSALRAVGEPRSTLGEALKAVKQQLPKVKPLLTEADHAAVDDTAGLEEVNAKNGKTASIAEIHAAGTAPTPPIAEAPQAAAPAVKVEYPELQAAVLALHKLDATAAKPIAEAMGFPNFKAMPDDKWAEALEKVKAKTEELKGGV